MAYITLKQINKAIAKDGIPLELERGAEGYHYFIYDNEELNVFETESVYVCYTNTYSILEWIDEAHRCLQVIRKELANRDITI